MKVRELIERLGTAPPDFEVYVETRERIRPVLSAAQKRVMEHDVGRRQFWTVVTGSSNAVLLKTNAGK